MEQAHSAAAATNDNEEQNNSDTNTKIQRLNVFANFNCEEHVFDAKLTPDGKAVAYCTLKGRVYVRNAHTPRLIAKIACESKAARAIEFSSDGKVLLVGLIEGLVHVYDVPLLHAHHAPRYTLVGHTRCVVQFAFLAANSQALSAAWDNYICHWDLLSGACLRHVKVPDCQCLRTMRLSPCGGEFATGGESSKLVFWNSATLEQVAQSGDVPRLIFALAYSSDGKYVYCGGQMPSQITQWDAKTHTRTHRDINLQAADCTLQLATVPKSAYLVSGHYQGTICVWDTTTQTLIHSVKGQDQYVVSVHAPANSHFVAVGWRSMSVKLLALR